MNKQLPSIITQIERAQASDEKLWYVLAHVGNKPVLGYTFGQFKPADPVAVQKQLHDHVEDLLTGVPIDGSIKIELVSLKHRVNAMAPRYDLKH